MRWLVLTVDVADLNSCYCLLEPGKNITIQYYYTDRESKCPLKFWAGHRKWWGWGGGSEEALALPTTC